MKAHHLTQTHSGAGAHPCPWEIHHLELVLGQQNVGLGVGDGDEVLSEPFDVVQFNILSGPLVEEVPQIFELV